MSHETDTKTLAADLGKALQLLARDALAASLAAGTLGGAIGVALSPRLREIAAADLADVERLAARVASLGGAPTLSPDEVAPPAKAEAAVEWLIATQREGLEAVVAAIPADRDDAEGEATEHLLEHVVARKRDAIELLERALG
jgi:hypothetical protein